MLEASVDADFHDALKLFAAAAGDVGTPWLVVGATARILLMERVYGWPSGSGTSDTDFAVQVQNWDHFRALCDKLQKGSEVDATGLMAKRFRTRAGQLFDLLPYGGVEEGEKQVFWPPDRDFLMTVRGFAGAARTALTVRVNGELDVPVVSPAGLCALKLFAWEERGRREIGRDAKDLAYLFQHIERLITAEVLHEAHTETVAATGYDIQLAALMQFGDEVQSLLAADERAFLNGIIGDEVEAGVDGRLVRDLHRYLAPNEPTRTAAMLSAFQRGIGTEAR